MRGVNQYPPDIPADLIRKKACQLIRHPGFSRDDQPDIEQELALACIRARSRYDPARGKPGPFFRKVVTNAARKLISAQGAKKRVQFRRAVAWQDFEDDEDRSISNLEDHIDVDAYLRWTGRDPRSRGSEEDLVLDVTAAEGTLADALRSLSQDLRGSTVSEIARDRRVPRQSVHRQKTLVKEHFLARGVDDYVKSSGQN